MKYRYINPENTIARSEDGRWSGLVEAIPTDDEIRPEIDPYIAPQAPTAEDRIDQVFPQTDSARVLFEALFELSNDLRSIKSQQPISREQLKAWLKSKLPAS